MSSSPGRNYRRYSFGVDSIDFDLVRSVFHPDCVVVGTLEEGTLDDYLSRIEEGLYQWEATMYFVGNQYIEVDDDRSHSFGRPTGEHA